MQRIPESSKFKCVDGVCVNVAKSLHTQFEATKKKTHIKRSGASKEGALVNLARSWDPQLESTKGKTKKEIKELQKDLNSCT